MCKRIQVSGNEVSGERNPNTLSGTNISYPNAVGKMMGDEFPFPFFGGIC